MREGSKKKTYGRRGATPNPKIKSGGASLKKFAGKGPKNKKQDTYGEILGLLTLKHICTKNLH